MPSAVFRPIPVLSTAMFLAMAISLSGCASKNPLMEEPVAAAKPSSPAAASAPAPAAANNTVASPSAKPATAPAGGVETSRERRLFGFLSPYRIDIQQGNFVSQEMVAQLKTGMTPDQVRFVLGTPLLTDIFHADRWDYVFRMEKGNGEIVSSRIAVEFKDNRLAKIDAGPLPTEKDYLSLIAQPAAK